MCLACKKCTQPYLFYDKKVYDLSTCSTAQSWLSPPPLARPKWKEPLTWCFFPFPIGLNLLDHPTTSPRH